MSMEISNVTLQYWTPEDFAALEKVDTAAGIFQVALRIISRMPKPFGQVCGPIGTGGFGDVMLNLHAFNETIHSLQAQGVHVFDQMPFEMPMQRIKENLKPGEYPESILTDFYLPLFKSGYITRFYFMPNWKTSHGAQWEHGLAQELGIEIKYL